MKGLAFHCHHDELVEYCHDYDERVRFIEVNKPKDEQELRLRLFKLIPDDLVPGKDSKEYAASAKAWEAYGKARATYGKAWEAYEKAWVASAKAWEAYLAREAYLAKYGQELDALHEKLCPDCTWDGETIFGGNKQ